jgi:hypothetical protein
MLCLVYYHNTMLSSKYLYILRHANGMNPLCVLRPVSSGLYSLKTSSANSPDDGVLILHLCLLVDHTSNLDNKPKMDMDPLRRGILIAYRP